MQEWRNIKVLHEKAVKQNKKYKSELKFAREEITKLRTENKSLRSDLEELKLQIEELKQIIFGKKQNDSDDNNNFPDLKKCEDKKQKKKRSKDSYQRKKPEPQEITEIKKHTIDQCPDCKIELTCKKIVVFYEEDIPLPEKGKQIKSCIEHQVEKGWCKKCKKWQSAITLPPAKVILGSKVKIYICYLSILLRISYPQIIKLLRDAYGFNISNGEIANILEKIGQKLRPEFERIKKRLQKGKGVHLDETSWRKLYLWVMASIETDDVLYLAGRNRGNGHIDELLGENFDKIRVSDAYPAYKNKPGTAQQCWAHPHRKLRDLANSSTLAKRKKKHCQKTYKTFSGIYKKLREYISKPYDKATRIKQKQQLLEQIRTWTHPNAKDPKKLKNIKLQFVNYEVEWFTCMDYDGVPCDNNKAERMLRHFVIKRKISFGTKTKKTSETFSVLASVFMTYWKKYEADFFSQIALLT